MKGTTANCFILSIFLRNSFESKATHERSSHVRTQFDCKNDVLYKLDAYTLTEVG